MGKDFASSKLRILSHFNQPSDSYQDLSPKGTVDAEIRDFLDEINTFDGLVTTSSCAGRISVFLEGRKTQDGSDIIRDFEESGTGAFNAQYGAATPGGKGDGGTWLFVSHTPLEIPAFIEAAHFHQMFKLLPKCDTVLPLQKRRNIRLKFEPFLLHLLSSSYRNAQTALTAAISAGFRESGVSNLVPSRPDTVATPFVGVRSSSMSFDCLVGYERDGDYYSIVTEEYLATMVELANQRFQLNTERIARFRANLLRAMVPSAGIDGRGRGDVAWEDARDRKIRRKREGLEKQRALQQAKAVEKTAKEDEMDDFNLELL